MADVLMKRAYKHTHREEGSVETEATIGVMRSQAKGPQGLPTATKSQERGREQSSPSGPLGGAHVANTLTLGFEPPELGDDKFLLFLLS